MTVGILTLSLFTITMWLKSKVCIMYILSSETILLRLQLFQYVKVPHQTKLTKCIVTIHFVNLVWWGTLTYWNSCNLNKIVSLLIKAPFIGRALYAVYLTKLLMYILYMQICVHKALLFSTDLYLMRYMTFVRYTHIIKKGEIIPKSLAVWVGETWLFSSF